MYICTKLKIFYVQHSSNKLCCRFLLSPASSMLYLLFYQKTSTHSRIPTPNTPPNSQPR